MSRIFNLIGVLLFLFVAAAANYVVAKGIPLEFAKNPEERELSTTNLLESKIKTQQFSFFIIEVAEIRFPSFPLYLALTQQIDPKNFFRPPAFRTV